MTWQFALTLGILVGAGGWELIRQYLKDEFGEGG